MHHMLNNTFYVFRLHPDMDKFIEMCFDPGSPINERLKETLREMLKEEEK